MKMSNYKIDQNAEEIAREILLIMKGDGDGNLDLVNKLLKGNSSADEFLKNMSNAEYLKNELANYVDNNKLEKTKMLTNKMKNRRSLRIVRNLFYATSSVAACIFLLFFMLHDNRTEIIEQSDLKSEIHIPNTPILIYENGESVSLSSNIALSEDINQDIDKLVYRSNDSTTTQKTEYHTVIVPNQCTYNLCLSDGTEIMLNAGSKIRYPKHFTKEKREVYLSGEAYFKVTKSTIPFIVCSDEIDIRVYGTEFNINLNKKSVIEAVLLTGKIGVSVKNISKDEVIMFPKQLFTMERENGSVMIQDIEPAHYISWCKGIFKTNEEGLSTLIEQISSWYGVEYSFASNEIKDIITSVELDRSMTINQVNSIIEAMTDKIIINEGNNQYMIK